MQGSGCLQGTELLLRFLDIQGTGGPEVAEWTAVSAADSGLKLPAPPPAQTSSSSLNSNGSLWRYLS